MDMLYKVLYGYFIILIYISLGCIFTAQAAIDSANVPSLSYEDIKCKDLKRSFLRVSVHGSNLRHFRVTQTPAGTPYEFLSLRCHRGNCTISKEARFVDRYLPNHPHANNKGFVRYPDIDPERERTALKAAITELSVLAQEKACGSSLRQTSDGLFIRYGLSRKVESDIFNFDQSNQITSWVRNFKNGKSVILNFN